MRNFKCWQILVVVLLIVFSMQACTMMQTRPEGMTDVEYEVKRHAEVVAFHASVGHKLIGTKQTIINQCATNILISKEDCRIAKGYYNLTADLFDVATSVSMAMIDPDNAATYLTKASADALLLSGNAKYTAIGGSAIAEIVTLIKAFPEMDATTRTEQVLRVLENQVLNVAMQLLLMKIEEEGGNG